MSLQIRDTISPGLSRLVKNISDRKPILEAMGMELVSITKRAFSTPDLRPASWPPKKDGTAATLRKSGALWQSIRITDLTNTHVTVGSDRAYAAIHQLGSRKKIGRGSGIPARPFFPFTPGGKMTELARKRVESIGRAKLNSILKNTPR